MLDRYYFRPNGIAHFRSGMVAVHIPGFYFAIFEYLV
jgi:hypothetical protein